MKRVPAKKFMARYNEILVGRYNRLIQKLLGMKGDASLFQFSTEMMAVLPLFNGAENRYLEAWDRFALSVQQGAVAGQFSTMKLRNPVGSNVVAVFEKIAVEFSQADEITLQGGTDQTDGATILATVGSSWDLRSQRGQGSTLLASRSGVAAPPSMVARARAQQPINTMYDFIVTDVQEVPLLPGTSLQTVNTTANTAHGVTFWWRERLLEESERA
jgi:hypothetical protein